MELTGDQSICLRFEIFGVSGLQRQFSPVSKMKLEWDRNKIEKI